MPKEDNKTPWPLKIRLDEEALDMIFGKAKVSGPYRQEPIIRLSKKLRKISQRNRS